MPRSWGLNFFLIDPAIHTEQDALEDTDDLHRHAVKDGVGFEGSLYFKYGKEHPPDWTKLVNPNLKKTVDFPESKSTAAVLFVRTANGFYAYTFGVGGRSLLNRDSYVPDFGKKAVLSIADFHRLRSIDLRAMRDQPFLTRQQPSRGTRMRAFGVDTLQDHLRAVTGIPHGAYVNIAKQVTGADSLAYRAALDFTDLGVKSDEFLAAYNTNAYQQIKDFAWVDQISFVRLQAEINTLDALMLTSVRQSAFEFAPPEFIEWDRGPTFTCVSDTAWTLRHEFLTSNSLEDAFGGNLNAVTIDQLKELKVFCFYDGSLEPQFKWRAYDCIEVEAVNAGEQYAFAGGRWSLIQAAFLQTVDNYVNTLKQGAPALPAATYQDDGNAKGDHVEEGKYIKRLTDNNPITMAKVHECGQHVSVDGDEVELCDIYDVAKDFIHLKIWRGSQGFSALAMQAANAAELLIANKQFHIDSRTLLEGLGNHLAGVLPDGFNPRDYRIVAGLIRKEAGDIPFFSRLTLMRAAERIEGKAVRVAFVVIPVQ